MPFHAHFLPTHADQDELHASLAFGLSEAKAAGTSLTIVVNSKGSATYLEGVIDKPVLNKLQTNARVTMQGVKVTLDSTRTLDRFKAYGTVLALHTSPQVLELLESIKEIGHIIVVGDAQDIDEAWLVARGSRPLAKSEPVAE